MKYKDIQQEKINKLEQFIRGSMLGDGWLSPQKTENTMSYIAFTHSPKQLDYLKWKKEIIEDCGINCTIRNYTHVSDRYKSGSCLSYTMTSKSHPIFTKFRQIYYKSGHKIIDRNDFKRLDLFGLAIWYMDDGNVWNRKNRSSCLTINTQSFLKEDILFMIDQFKEKWDILSTYNKSDNTIRISSKSTSKLIDLIRPYIIDSLMYKTVHVKLGETGNNCSETVNPVPSQNLNDSERSNA